VDRLRPTAQDPHAMSCLLFFSFFFFFLLSEGIGRCYYTKPMGGYHHFNCHSLQSPVSLLHCSSPLPHALFVLSSIFLAPEAKQWHCMLSLSPFPHILFTFYFQFILVFGCVVYVVFMRYFVKNLGFYFIMGLLKIPDPIRLTRPTRPKKTLSKPLDNRRFFTFLLLSQVRNYHTRLARVGWPNGLKPARTDPCPALES
jgi:hypothetical protein